MNLLSLASTALVVFATTTASAEYNSTTVSLTPEQSQSLINAFRVAGVQGKVADQNLITYNFDLSCRMVSGLSEDPKSTAYAMDSYFCDIGAGKFGLSKAMVIFNAAAKSIGVQSVDNNIVTEAKGLECKTRLNDTQLDTRFTCTYQN